MACLQQLLPDASHCQASPCMEGAEGAHEDGHQHEEGHVTPAPMLRNTVPLINHEGFGVGAAEVQQGAGDECADRCARKGPEGHLQRPRVGGDLLEHVDDATNRRVKEHRHAAGAAHSADHPLRNHEPLLIDQQRRGATRALCVHSNPLPHIRKSYRIGEEIGEVAAHGDGRALTAHRVARHVGEEGADRTADQAFDGEEAGDAIAVQPALVLWRT
mmetsp:Transcript_54687/g.140792  ORF Transcript_54687/g.140792 Transcript_54687/m.140792 type:complete len:216 (-) Transcript_54687:527-1174(-)